MKKVIQVFFGTTGNIHAAVPMQTSSVRDAFEVATDENGDKWLVLKNGEGDTIAEVRYEEVSAVALSMAKEAQDQPAIATPIAVDPRILRGNHR